MEGRKVLGWSFHDTRLTYQVRMSYGWRCEELLKWQINILFIYFILKEYIFLLSIPITINLCPQEDERLHRQEHKQPHPRHVQAANLPRQQGEE